MADFKDTGLKFYFSGVEAELDGKTVNIALPVIEPKVLQGGDGERRISSIQPPPCNFRRKQGQGTGYVQSRQVKRGEKTYIQHWFHYEIWRSGKRAQKTSKYIPKKALSKVIKLNEEKAAIATILKVIVSS